MTAMADVARTTTRTNRRPVPAEAAVTSDAPEPQPAATETTAPAPTPLEAPVEGSAPADPAPEAAPVPVLQNAGYCSCCRNQTLFVAYDSWLRDHYICTRCGSVPRQRHLQTVLDESISGWTDLVVHESSPSNDLISRLCSNYSASQYFLDVPRGEYKDGVRSEDVEALTFADESIDLFITQDVLEHVFNPDRAIREIHRVLKPGGAHVFTAPKHRGLDISRRRARLGADGVVDHLLPEEYHGNPIGDNKALVTWDYGYDFEQLMSEWAGAEVQAHHRRDRGRGLDAEFNEVFVIRKAHTAARPARWEPPRGRRAALGQIRPALGQIKRSIAELARPTQ